MIGAVLSWKERIFRLQLQFFSPCYVGMNCCNVSPFLYRILSFQNKKCNNFVPNGSFHIVDETLLMRGHRQSFVCSLATLAQTISKTDDPEAQQYALHAGCVMPTVSFTACLADVLTVSHHHAGGPGHSLSLR